MNFEIALVIPVYNESLHVEIGLERFSKHADNRVLLVIIDNNSTDDTALRIRKWTANHQDTPLILLSCTRRGAMYARRIGMEYAKAEADILLSSDIDSWPTKKYYSNIRTNFLNSGYDILRGHARYEPHIRLLKRLYLPNLMRQIEWQEQIESDIFGKFFFGGYFGVRNSRVTDDAFPTSRIPLPEEGTIFWSRHCWYLGYSFVESEPDMHTSNRRFWNDPYGSVSGVRSEPIRSDIHLRRKQTLILKNLQGHEPELMMKRTEYFTKRSLCFLLDAIVFIKTVRKSERAEKSLEKGSEFFQLRPSELRRLSTLPFRTAQNELLNRHAERIKNYIEKIYRQTGQRTSA